MALITRLSRLFQADFHAVLDRIEEPDIQLKQAVREMEFALQQNEQTLALLQHEQAQLEDRVQQQLTEIDSFDQELDICFAAKKDNLARDLIRRKLECESLLKQLQQQLQAVEGQSEVQQKAISSETAQLTSMRQKLDLLVGQSDSALNTTRTSTIRDEEIEIALLREKQLRSRS